MSTKQYCDACGKESICRSSICIPVHLWSKRTETGYVDSDMNRISGRGDHVDLCNKCCNMVFRSAAEMIIKIQKDKA